MKLHSYIIFAAVLFATSASFADAYHCGREQRWSTSLGTCQYNDSEIVIDRTNLVQAALDKNLITESSALFFRDELDVAYSHSTTASERSNVDSLRSKLNSKYPEDHQSQCKEGFKTNALNACSIDVATRLNNVESEINNQKITPDTAQIYYDELNMLLQNSASTAEQKIIRDDIAKVGGASALNAKVDQLMQGAPRQNASTN